MVRQVERVVIEQPNQCRVTNSEFDKQFANFDSLH